MIKYLLKFTSEESHAIDLLNGKLFMRPACYYWDLEKGQGDLREGAVSPIGQIYKNPNYAIFCFSYVEDTDIKDGKVEIDKKLVDDCAKNGFVTIIDFKKYEQIIDKYNFLGCQLLGEKVQYTKFSIYDTPKLIDNDNNLQLFIKHPSFSYQKEFRFVVPYKIENIFIEKEYNGTKYKEQTDYGKQVFFMKENGNLYEFSKIIKIKDLETNDIGNYILTIPSELKYIK